MKKFAFFLGGYDAEMVSIQKILTETGEKIFDNALSWNNAKLSTYKQEMESLAEDEIPVFIELQLDCSFSDNSIIIDHHNENAGIDKATSIEQVAALIDIKLNRFQQLISANDRGHIRGMMKLCATEDEIQKIRRFDREAQGVTEEDEKLAERSIRERLEVIDGHTAIVDSLTEKTSPIFDALYGKHTHIFILTPEGGLNYSGTGEMVDRLDNIYSGLREKEPDFKFWKGGELPESGFFGADKQFSTDMRRVITSMVDGTPNKIISNHIFMFPFTIEMKNGCTENSSMHDTKLFFNNITASLQKSGWYNKAFRPDSSNLAYNEFFYFHKFARNAIYDIGSQSECDNSKYKDKPNPLILYFTRDTKDGKFEITLKTGETYSLDLQNISIRIYGTEIGILVIEASNKSHRNIEDIIKINDYGRRLYPQFLDEINGVDTTKDVFLADKILMKFKGFESSESFELNDFRKRHIVVAEYVRKLLGEDFTTDDSGDSVKSRRRPYFVYSPIIDDRMYVVCWYGSDEYSDKIKEKDLNGDFCYEDDQMWYRFIFLDGNDVNCKHPGMMKSLIRGTTYKRWAGDGILYGISRYSLVCISGSSGNIVRGHMRKMYAQMAVLLLAQRASILQFSNRVAHISKQIEMLSIIKENNEVECIASQVETLHAEYIRFVNSLWFTEVTPQEQGIEMYEMALDIMDLKTSVADLKSEIKELYEFVSLSNERASNRQMNTLTILGAVSLPLVVTTGFFGMNLAFIDPGISEAKWLAWIVSVGLFTGASFLCFRWMKGYLKNMKAQMVLKELKCSKLFYPLECIIEKCCKNKEG